MVKIVQKMDNCLNFLQFGPYYSMRSIKKIFIHCSDSPDSIDFSVRDIDAWHKENGWKARGGVHCGYHYVIRRSGVVERGREDQYAGVHVRGQNRSSIGICLIGRKQFTMAQMQSLFAITRGLMHQYQVDITDVLGHYEYEDKKTCPNLDMKFVRANLIFKD